MPTVFCYEERPEGFRLYPFTPQPVRPKAALPAMARRAPELAGQNLVDGHFRLYLGEFSTTEALRLFDPCEPLSVVRFGATGLGRLGWATETDLPSLPTAGAACAFLDERDVGLIDFVARLGDWAMLGSHDDGECWLLFRERSALLSILERVVPANQKGRLIHAILANPGTYVALSPTGTIVRYPTFEAYLARDQ